MRPFNLLLPSQNFILDGSCDKNKSLSVGNMERSLNLVQYCKLLFEILDQDFSYKKAQTIPLLFSYHPNILFSFLSFSIWDFSSLPPLLFPLWVLLKLPVSTLILAKRHTRPSLVTVVNQLLLNMVSPRTTFPNGLKRSTASLTVTTSSLEMSSVSM